MAGLLGTSEAMPELQGEFGEAARRGNLRRPRVRYARYGGAADALRLSLFSGLRPGSPMPTPGRTPGATDLTPAPSNPITPDSHNHPSESGVQAPVI